MSTIIRTRRRGNPTLSTVAVWLTLGLIALFFLVQYGQQVLLAHDLNDKASAQRIQNTRLQDENSRLQAQLQYYGSDKYIEQRAREDLNLRRPQEEVLIPIITQPTEGKVSALNTDKKNTNIEPSTPTPQLPNWQRWFNLFSYEP